MNENVSIIVLSGGQGRRFGNVDKGLVRWQGKPLIQHVIDRLRPQSDQILISCNRNLVAYQALELELFTDQDEHFLGPLAGVQAAATAVIHPWCLLCPNDIPLLPNDLVGKLLASLISQQAEVAYPVCGSRHHFLPAMVRSAVLPGVASYLKNGGRSLHGWYKKLNACSVEFSDQSNQFVNINNPLTLAELESR